MKKVLLIMVILLLIPLRVRAAELSSDNILVDPDAGISTVAFGFDGFRNYTLLPSSAYSISTYNSSQFLYVRYDFDEQEWRYFNSSSGYDYSGVYTAVKSASGLYEFDMPIIYMQELNPLDNGYGNFNGLHFRLNSFSCPVTYTGGYLDTLTNVKIAYYTISYNGVNGSGSFNVSPTASALYFHVPSDRCVVTVMAHVVLSPMYKSTGSGSNQFPVGAANYVVSVKPTFSASVYGYVNIPAGEYSNVVNLNTIAGQQVTYLHYLDYLDDTYSQVAGIRSDLGVYYQNIAKALTDTYGLINAIRSDLTTYDARMAGRFESLNTWVSRVNNAVLQLDANEGSRFSALYSQLSVINSEIQTHMTNENTRLINALLHETEYPDGDAGAGNLEDAFGKYDKAESEVTNTAFEWVGAFDPGSLIDFTGNIVVGIGQFNSFLSSLLSAMGYYQYVIYIGLGLVFCAILVGVLRFRG